MKFNDYQEQAHVFSKNTRVGGNVVMYPLLGLSGEVGEICEKFKKLYRDGDGVPSQEFLPAVKKELGDVLWYIAELSTKLGLSLCEIASENIEKLASRQARNLISGSGDNR